MAIAQPLKKPGTMISPEALSGIDAFSQLSLADRKALATHCQCQRFGSGEQIVTYQEPSRDVFFIISGNVQAINYSASGQQVTLQDLEAGDMFGELSAIDGEPRSAHVVASDDALVAMMPARDFMTVLRHYPAVAEVTLTRLSSMVRRLTKQVFERDVLPANCRVRAELLRLAKINPQGESRALISPAPTHNSLATHIGSSRETVTREMANLKRQGLIVRRGSDLVICDINKLSRMLGQDGSEPSGTARSNDM